MQVFIKGLSFEKGNEVENVVPVPAYRYEVVDGKWSMMDFGRKGRSFGETDKVGLLFKDSYKILLTSFNEDIEMFKINKR